MLLLVTDTSGKHGSVALVRAGEDSASNDVKVVEAVPLAGGTFSAQLVPQVKALLAKHAFTRNDIGAFVVVSGPGSFTGLRVGLAAIKALGEILRKPIVPVSLLEVIAVAAASPGKIVAALDAGRGEVYVREYDTAAESAQPLSEQLVARDEFLSAAPALPIATPDRALSQLAREAGRSLVDVEVSAYAIARLGYRKLLSGETVSPEQLEANYIRRSDAELLLKNT